MADCCAGKQDLAKGKTCCCGAGQLSLVKQIDGSLALRDILGRWKARWGIGRMNFKVEPGLYGLNNPDRQSPVLVTANYRMTFDLLRHHMAKERAWILVLDTKGVNVWCAAGKGTFGTDELVGRIQAVGLQEYVDHRRLLLPQLGAPGVAAHQVKAVTGFDCTYGPVSCADLKDYLAKGAATKAMRQVNFPLKERLALIPMELVPALRVAMPVFGIMFLSNLILTQPFGLTEFIAYAGSIGAGCLLLPLLLPFLPFRSFSLKGCLVGLFWAVVFAETILPALGAIPPLGQIVGYYLLLTALPGVYAVLFTGSTPVTSLSGVERELKLFSPWLAGMILVGLILSVSWRF